MSFSVSGCSLAPALGACTSNDNCPGAFTGADATDGLVSQCSGSNVGVSVLTSISFNYAHDSLRLDYNHVLLSSYTGR